MNRKILATIAACACLLALLALPRPHTGTFPETPQRPAPVARPEAEQPNAIPVVRVYLRPGGKHAWGSLRIAPAEPLGEDSDPWHAADAQGWGPWAIHQMIQRVGVRPPEDGDYSLRPSDVGHWLLPISPWLAAAALEEERYFGGWEARYAREAGADDEVVEQRTRRSRQQLAQAIIARTPEHPAAALGMRIALQDKPYDIRNQDIAQREALDAMHASPTRELARAHLGWLVDEPKVHLSKSDFDLLADLLDGYEAKWPLAVMLAAQAAYEQGLDSCLSALDGAPRPPHLGIDTAPWIARGDRALSCGSPAEGEWGTCSAAHDVWRGLRPQMATPAHWIEAVHAAARACASDGRAAALGPGTYRASGRYRGGWDLRAHDESDQPYFDCVVEAIALPADEGQRVHLDVRVLAPK